MTDLRTRIANALRTARKERGWTLHETERRIGCAHGIMGNWENGRCLPRLDNWADACVALGIDSDAVLYGQRDREDAA